MQTESQKPLLLIVDEMPTNIQVLAETLRGDYRIKVATSGRAALEIVARESAKPDLILLDVTMSEMDGYEVCRRLKEDPDTRGIPVIFVTARNDAADEEYGLRLGAMDYIAKPFHPAIVRARVRNHIELQQTAKVLRERERDFHSLADNVPDQILRCDCEGRVLYLNKTLEATFGRPAAELVGNTADESFPDRRFAVLDQAIRQVGATGQAAELEQIVPGPDGEPRYHMFRIVAEAGADGKPASVLAVGRDRTEKKKAEEDLRQADRRKDEFLAMLAHELRNPLAPIRNAAHVLGRLPQQDSRLQWAQATIEAQVAHLTRLVDDLLDVSRIVRGKAPLKKERVEFAALAERVLEGARPLAQSRGHRLTVALPAQPVHLDVDPVRLSQVLHNLLDNAAKYTPDGGRIVFDAQVSGPEIEIRVHDNGVGIAPDLLPRVFDLFQQGERSLDRAQGGLGIGLTLVKRLVGLHGGSVEAHSDGPDRGATFTVRMPVVAAPPIPVRAAAPERAPGPGIRFLLVEDDPAVADSTAVLLDMVGHEVRIAANGPAALEQVPAFRPHAVLLDIGLEGMDGFEVAKRLRQLPEGRELCLIAITGYGDEKTRAAILEAGCDRHMTKPIGADRLLSLLAEVGKDHKAAAG